MSSAECFIVFVIVVLAVADACVYVSIKKRLDVLEDLNKTVPMAYCSEHHRES